MNNLETIKELNKENLFNIQSGEKISLNYNGKESQAYFGGILKDKILIINELIPSSRYYLVSWSNYKLELLVKSDKLKEYNGGGASIGHSYNKDKDNFEELLKTEIKEIMDVESKD
jgi:hypothetical protein